MDKLRCGVILTDAFVAFLRREAARQEMGSGELVAIIEYVKCVEGQRAGESWWKLAWGRAAGREEWCLFPIDGLRIYLSKQTQHALKWKHIDYRDGTVTVPE